MTNTYRVTSNTGSVSLNNNNSIYTITYSFSRSGDSLIAEYLRWSILGSPELYGNLFQTVNEVPFLGSQTLFPSGLISFASGQTTATATLRLGIADGNFGAAEDGLGYSFGLRLGATGTVTTAITDSASGGVGVTERYYTIQGGGGTFTFQYDMYSIPDRADIYVNGVLAQTTGRQVSGTGTLTIGGSILPPATSVRVVMTGTDPGTAWDYKVNYIPGLTADIAAYVNVIVPDPSQLDLAQLSKDVYLGRSTGNDSYVPYGQDLEFAGLRVQAYRNADTSEVVFAVRGTHDADWEVFVKNWLTNTSFATGFANFSLSTAVALTSDYVGSVAKSLNLTGDDITMTGHSLGGAIAQLVAKGAGVNAVVFDAPGAGQLFSNLSSELAPVKGLGTGGTSSNIRLRGDQVSLIGQAIGTQVTLTSPYADTIANLGANHDLDKMIDRLQANAPTTSVGANFASIFSTALDFAVLRNPVYAAGAFTLSLVVDAAATYLLDPGGTTTFELTLRAGSPAFRAITLFQVDDVATYYVSAFTSGSWIAPQPVMPGATFAAPSGATGLRFSAVGSDGSYTVLPNSFFFQLGFASAGRAEIDLTTRSVSYAHDIDGNRSADLLWQSDAGQAATWLLDGGAILKTGFTGPANGAAWRIAGSGDFNADARSDMVWINNQGQAAVWLSDDLDIYRSDLIGTPNGVGWRVRAIGDVNGDTRDDIIWQNQAGQAAIWFMDGLSYTGAIALGTPNGGNWIVRGVADLNADGRGDIIWQDSAGKAVAWLMDATSVQSAVTLGVISASGGTNWTIRGFGDFNNDTRDDIVWQDDNGQAVVWLMNGANVTASIAIGTANGAEWNIRQVADLNEDGHADLVWQNHEGQAVEWLLTKTNFATRFASIGGANGSNWSIVTNNENKTQGDLDGDGRADLVWADANGQAVLWRMNGANVIAGEKIGDSLGADWHLRSSDDISGDGLADLIWQNAQGQTVAWIMHDNGVAAAAAVGGQLGAQWRVMATGDLNGDGMADIVVQNGITGEAVAWLMNGTTITSARAIGGANGPDWQVRAMGDINGDGSDDIIWENTGGQAAVWLTQGAQILAASLVGGANGASFDIAGVADLNADGREEIIWEAANGQAGVWFMNGTNITSAAPIGHANGSGWHVADIGDFNADGLDDLAWRDSGGQAVIWTMNELNILTAGIAGGRNGAEWEIV